jgi:hypothetical protein
MTDKSQGPKGRDGVLSSPNVVISALSRAKEATSAAPAKTAFTFAKFGLRLEPYATDRRSPLQVSEYYYCLISYPAKSTSKASIIEGEGGILSSDLSGIELVRGGFTKQGDQLSGCPRNSNSVPLDHFHWSADHFRLLASGSAFSSELPNS